MCKALPAHQLQSRHRGLHFSWNTICFQRVSPCLSVFCGVRTRMIEHPYWNTISLYFIHVRLMHLWTASEVNRPQSFALHATGRFSKRIVCSQILLRKNHLINIKDPKRLSFREHSTVECNHHPVPEKDRRIRMLRRLGRRNQAKRCN